MYNDFESLNKTWSAALPEYDMDCNLVIVNKSTRPRFILQRLVTCIEEFRMHDNTLTSVAFVTVSTTILLSLFVAIATVCDDYFVPCLKVISEKLRLSDAVAGATFMAIGSSAPEFFASCISTINETDIGAGTITGSAMFNLLMICAVTTFYVDDALCLDWRPFFRDAFFYCISLIILIHASWDTKWSTFEASLLILFYCVYLVFMVFDEQLMKILSWVTERWDNDKVEDISDTSLKMKDAQGEEEKPMRRKSSSLYTASWISHSKKTSSSIQSLPPSVSLTTTQDQLQDSDSPEETATDIDTVGKTSNGWVVYNMERITFLLGFPFLVLFTFTIPNCSKTQNRKYYLITFLSSVVWIMVITYGMLVIIVQIGCCLHIQEFVMSVVFLAAGTSIPDMLSSMFVARNGQADMAVSNILGSNLFDINIGIGFPILVSSLASGGYANIFPARERVAYCENRMLLIPHCKFGWILIIILFIMMLVLAQNKFRLTKKIGILFLSGYVLFVGYALFQEFVCRPRGYIC